MALVQDAVADDDNPAAQVADRASSLRITGLKTYGVGPVVYLKIETNHGVSGWGDVKGVDPRPAKVLAESLFELLDGENPTRIEHLWQTAAAVKAGVGYPSKQQQTDGSWKINAGSYQDGVSALCTLALLNGGADVRDDRAQRALRWLRGEEPKMTYSVALHTVE